MSYQPEERYWTDYLRIALPVVGLLLMLGLFWYWASAVIGNDGNNEPTKTPKPNIALITQEAPTATSTSEVNINADNVTATATTGDAGAGDNPTEVPTDTPVPDQTQPDVIGKGFEDSQKVVTIEGGVNMRDGKSLDGAVVAILEKGTELSVIEAGTEVDANNRVWVGVSQADGTEGYVSDEFLDPSE